MGRCISDVDIHLNGTLSSSSSRNLLQVVGLHRNFRIRKTRVFGRKKLVSRDGNQVIHLYCTGNSPVPWLSTFVQIYFLHFLFFSFFLSFCTWSLRRMRGVWRDTCGVCLTMCHLRSAGLSGMFWQIEFQKQLAETLLDGENDATDNWTLTEIFLFIIKLMIVGMSWVGGKIGSARTTCPSRTCCWMKPREIEASSKSIKGNDTKKETNRSRLADRQTGHIQRFNKCRESWRKRPGKWLEDVWLIIVLLQIAN